MFCFQFFLFFYAWSQGDVTRLTQGYDVSGNICGKDNEPVDLEDGKTVLFRYNLIIQPAKIMSPTLQLIATVHL